MSVLLDTGVGQESLRSSDQWRVFVQRKQSDPVYRAAVEANLAPHFSRIEWALQDEDLLKELRSRQ